MSEEIEKLCATINAMMTGSNEPISLERFPVGCGASPIMVIPDNCAIRSLEEFMPMPRRVRQCIDFHTMDSFLSCWRRFNFVFSVVFADKNKMQFTAIFDYHANSSFDGADNCDNRAVYRCPLSNEWEVWTSKNLAKMSQADFAQFIEDNIEDIIARDNIGPTGAQMLETARSLEIHNNIQFKSSLRLDNGEIQLMYNEDIGGNRKTGNMKIPSEFYIAVPVFMGDTPYSVKARLRYRMSAGAVVFWYDLYRIDKVLDDAFDRMCGILKGVVDEGMIFYGTPLK